MMKGWTKRLSRSKSSASDKNRKSGNSSGGDDQQPSSIQPLNNVDASTDVSRSHNSRTSKTNQAEGFHTFGRSSSGNIATDHHIRPEAFDMSNTGVSSRRGSTGAASSTGSRDSLAGITSSKRQTNSKDSANHGSGSKSSIPTAKSSRGSSSTHSSGWNSNNSSSSGGHSPDLKVVTQHTPSRESQKSPINISSPRSPSFGAGNPLNPAQNNPNASGSTPGTPLNTGNATAGTNSVGNGGFGSPGVDSLATTEFRGGGIRRGRLDRLDGIDVPQRHNSSRLEVSAERQLEQLPSFDEVPEAEHMALFFAKIEQCNVMFNFSDPGSDALGKEIKRVALCELIDFVSTGDIFLGGEKVCEVVVGMFSRNIIRSIPPPKNPFGDIYDPDDDEPVNVDAWPHMSLVYELFLRFIDAPDLNVAVARQCIDQSFILSLLELFDSEDPRERDYLKTTLHRIYGKFLNTRPFIRRSINNVFLQFIYESGRFNGVAELLEIFGSIINGFALPLKEEHKVFLSRVLIPLHTARSLGQYHSHLTYCIVQFLEKDPTLTQEVVMGLLRFWPKVSSPKEILFLLELEDIFDAMEPNEFVKIEVPVFTQLARCISSPHGQVAERALCNWTHEYFSTLVAENSEVILPILFPALCENSGHWNRTIHSMVHSATKMFLEANPMLYEKCAAEYRDRKLSEKNESAKRNLSWKKIEKMAQTRLQQKQESEQNRLKREQQEQASIPTNELGQSSVQPSFREPRIARDPALNQGAEQAAQTVQRTSSSAGVPTAVTTHERSNPRVAAVAVAGLQYTNASKKSPQTPQSQMFPSNTPSSLPTSPPTSAPGSDNALQTSESISLRDNPRPNTLTVPNDSSLPKNSHTDAVMVNPEKKQQLSPLAQQKVPSQYQPNSNDLSSVSLDNKSESSSNSEEGFEDAPGPSPSASPWLMSCPSSPEN